MQRWFALILTTLLAAQTTGCGLLLYPERQGQKGGRIDPGVAILDAAGLVVFIVPGLIAFGVDFVTGCIYLPGSGTAAKGVTPAIYPATDTLDEAAIASAVEGTTGWRIDLAAADIEAVRVADLDTLTALVAADRH